MSAAHGHSAGFNEVLIGDALEQLGRLPEAYVDLVLTSPPYFRLRDYDVAGQLGMEGAVDEWVQALRLVARQLGRVLTPTGSLWLNLGDSYSMHPREGAARKSLLLGPERLLLALQADGWTVRNKVVWAKTNPIPSPVRDRLATTWEAVFFLTRGPRYYFDLDDIRLPHKTAGAPPSAARRPSGRAQDRAAWRGPSSVGRSGLDRLRATGRVGHPLGKNPGDVWPLASARGHGSHHAAFPLSLADRVIRAASPALACTQCGAAVSPDGAAGCTCQAPRRCGRVLDPFMGSGTTALAAALLGRDWLGIELNPDFAAQAAARAADGRRPGQNRAPPKTETPA